MRLLLKRGKVRTYTDYFNAALIFQHGLTLSDYKLAQALAGKSVKKGGGEWSRWLYAVVTDRLLLARGKKQKYGSQLRIDRTVDRKSGHARRIMKLLPYDARTSDATRAKFALPPLAELLRMDGRPAPIKQKKISFQLDLDSESQREVPNANEP